MIATIEESALMRGGKTVVHIGDLVRLELNQNVWQVVAISGAYTKSRDVDGNLVETEKYHRYMVRKLFNKKGEFKPSQYAECVHQNWAFKPRKDKLEELNRYLELHPQDKVIAYDLPQVQPEVNGGVNCLANFKGADINTILNELRAEVGYPVRWDIVEKVIADWVKRGKAETYRGINIEADVKQKYPYRIFVCGYQGYIDENSDDLYETVGIDLSSEETNYWFNIKNARKAIKEAGKEINGVFNVF